MLQVQFFLVNPGITDSLGSGYSMLTDLLEFLHRMINKLFLWVNFPSLTVLYPLCPNLVPSNVIHTTWKAYLLNLAVEVSPVLFVNGEEGAPVGPLCHVINSYFN